MLTRPACAFAAVAALVVAGCAPPHPPPPKPPPSTLDDAARTIPHEVPPPRTGVPGAGLPDTPPSAVPSAADELERRAARDEALHEVVCYAYDTFYDADTGELVLPDGQTFADNTAGALAPPGTYAHYRSKAQDAFALLEDVEAGELADVAVDLACV